MGVKRGKTENLNHHSKVFFSIEMQNKNFRKKMCIQ